MTPAQLYNTLAIVAKHMNEHDQHFVCLIARSKDGRFHVFNGETLDVDDLVGAAKAINETMEGFKNKLNG